MDKMLQEHMPKENSEQMPDLASEQTEEIEEYGEPNIASKDAKVPRWLKFFYVILPIWGICVLYWYINGSQGWLDRGYWNQLQKAALTTFPTETLEELKTTKK